MKPMFITTSWDDGHVLDLRVAALLRRYGISGTFYIAPQSREISPEKRLSPEQVRELSREFEIGAHTMTHPVLTALEADEARAEIVRSKQYLERVTGTRVFSFCYPRGRYDETHKRSAQEAGFTRARTVERFLSMPKSAFAMPTTVHAFRHLSDAVRIFRAVGARRFLSCYLNWDELAIALFDSVRSSGGVYHLWGHSWEIERNGDWRRLERVLRHIAHHPEVRYVPNKEIPVPEHQKNVLFVTPYFPPEGGGLESYAYEMAKRARRDWNVTVVTSGSGRATITERVDGMTIHRVRRSFMISNTPFSFSWWREVRRLIREERPDLINVHMPVPGIGDIACMLAGGVPVVLTYHSGSMRKGRWVTDRLIWLYENALLPFALRRARIIVCPSDFVRTGFLGRYAGKSVTIPPSVDTARFTPDERKIPGKRIIFVAGLGRAEQHKGLTLLLEAMSQASADIPDLSLTVAGDGDMREEYRSIGEALGLARRVHFTGRLAQEALIEAYRQADVLVLPTTNDSSPMVILEAMACGLPVVSTNTGGIARIVEDGRTGFVVEPNSRAAIAEKIRILCTDSALVAAFGAAGREKVQRQFDSVERAAEYNYVLKDALQDPASVVHIVGYYPPHVGGMERVAETISSKLADRGRRVRVLTSDIRGEGRDAQYAKNLSITRLASFEFAHTPIAPTLLWHLLRLPKNSILHLHLSQAYWPELVLLVSKLRRLPYIVHFHLDVAPSGTLGPLFVLYKKLLWGPLLRLARKVVVLSEEQSRFAQQTYGVDPARIVVVPNGIDERYFLEPKKRAEPGPLRLLFVGRLVPQKRVDRIIKALSLVKRPAHLTVIGDGEERSRLERLCRKLLLQNVTFTGYQTEEATREYFANSDALLISSDREGMPLVVLEAMAAGVPIIGANIPGISELMRGIGILVDPSPQAFADAIESFAGDRMLAAGASARGVARARQYSWNAQIEKLDTLYREIAP